VTTLVLKELITTLEQDINFNLNVRYNIGALIPYIYMHNAPAGTFTIELIKSSVTIFSNTFTSVDLKASLGTTDNYAHVFYPIVPTDTVQIERGIYTVKLSSSGYTYNSSSFLGWCQQYVNIQGTLDYVPANYSENPLSIRVKTYKEGIK